LASDGLPEVFNADGAILIGSAGVWRYIKANSVADVEIPIFGDLAVMDEEDLAGAVAFD
jgi:hypothetical protein